MAVIAMTTLAATGCQKENIVEQENQIVADAVMTTVYYTVDGITIQASFSSEEEWTAFLHRLVALAEEGHRVSFRNANHERGITKETVTYVTKNHDDAVAWGDMMRKNGYEVYIDFDTNTNEYICTAIK